MHGREMGSMVAESEEQDKTGRSEDSISPGVCGGRRDKKAGSGRGTL